MNTAFLAGKWVRDAFERLAFGVRKNGRIIIIDGLFSLGFRDLDQTVGRTVK
jgi:hypothetical protein